MVWLVPFAVSCTLIGPDGKKAVSEQTFRTIMLLVGSMSSSWCTFKCQPETTHEGLVMAIKWLVINWVMDLIVLVPLFAMQNGGSLTLDNYIGAVPEWFLGIGLAYIGFVSSVVVAGACTERASIAAKRR